ncbi:MAG: DUF1893 domain-containing protein [Clostridiales bacterium]|nr:DUF1893 domain-containing protein [Clostridiales bacterium]
MNDILTAKALLSDDVRCAVINGQKTFVSGKKGIAPLLELIDNSDDYRGCVAADKIVGKAAALLYVKLGAVEVYAEVLSNAAIDVLEGNGIKYTYGSIVEFIHNRQGDGMCPMEMTVANIIDPDSAVIALKEKIAALRKMAN